MRVRDTRALFADSFEFPVEGATVVETVGDVLIESPNKQPQSIADVLGTVPEQRFESLDELFTTLLGYVDDRYVGSKYYDERGAVSYTVADPRRAPEDLWF